MSDALRLSYGQQLACLADMMATQWQWPSPDGGFAMYVGRAVGQDMPIAATGSTLTDAYRRRLAEGPVLAAAGYLLAVGGGDHQLHTDWAAGLARLTTRQAFPRDRESFFFRPLELLGVCVGLTACAGVDPSHRQWLVDVVKHGADHLKEADLWVQLLTACAAHLLGVTWDLPRLPRAEECALEELALLVWLHMTRPELLQAVRPADWDRETQEALMLRAALAPLPHYDAGRAAVVHIALTVLIQRFISSSTERNWQLGRDARDAVELVRTLCSRFHLFALQLQKRHNQRPTIQFEDEYDVQDTMHALLRLHFDDVRPEEWTPSYAGSSSRTDFLLKREQVVVETKVTRTRSRKLDQKEIANQLIIDARRYQSHPSCKTLICFVYDPDHLCDNVAALENDVSSQGPPLRVEVIVAPRGL